MANVQNFTIVQQGQQVRIKGDIYEDQINGGAFIESFDVFFVPWYQALPVEAQIEIAHNLSNLIIENSLGNWPITQQ